MKYELNQEYVDVHLRDYHIDMFFSSGICSACVLSSSSKWAEMLHLGVNHLEYDQAS